MENQLATDPVAETTPPVAVVADPAPAPEPAAADPAPAAVITDPPKKEPPKWALDRISEISAKKREAEDRAAAAERRAQEAEALAERLRQAQGTAAPDPAARSAAPPSAIDPNQFQSEVNRAAAAQNLYRDSLAVKNAGVAKFGQGFQESLGILNSLGATTDDFITDVLAVDRADAHIILNDLARDPERAVALTQMDSRARIAELTRISMAKAAPAATTTDPAPPAPRVAVTKAPAPAPAITPSTTRTVDWRSDAADDAAFSRGWEENQKRRAEARRGR